METRYKMDSIDVCNKLRCLYKEALSFQKNLPSNPAFWAQNGSKYPFSGHKSTKTPLKHGKLGINRVVIIVVIYQYTLHEAKAIFHNSIAPNPLFLGSKWVKMSVFRGKVNRNTTKALKHSMGIGGDRIMKYCFCLMQGVLVYYNYYYNSDYTQFAML